MIVVAVVGVLAALAIYGVRKYLLNSKTAEAKNALGQMAKDAKTAYERESMSSTILTPGSSAALSNNLCETVSGTVPVAITSVQGKKYQSTAADWNADSAILLKGFACLKFSVSAAAPFVLVRRPEDRRRRPTSSARRGATSTATERRRSFASTARS